ncbi:hypothetical protein CVU75_01130, partial [Candidatus Dependentiae bacterium HGW-Dependentiae-1]
EDFDVVEAADKGDQRLVPASAVLKKYYSLNLLALYTVFKKQCAVDAQKALEMLPEIIAQAGIVALALAGKTSMRECERAFEQMCDPAMKKS